MAMSMKTFYFYGSILMAISVIGSAISAKLQWVALNIGSKISTTSSVVFQILLLVLFAGLYMQVRKQEVIMESSKMEAFLEELKSSDKKEEKQNGKNNIKNKY